MGADLEGFAGAGKPKQTLAIVTGERKPKAGLSLQRRNLFFHRDIHAQLVKEI